MASEATYSAKLIKSLRAAGIPCAKTSDRYTSGFPDIYVAGGNWVETKKVPMGIRHGYCNVKSFFSSNQKEFAKLYSRAQDLVCWYVIFYDKESGRALYRLLAPHTFWLTKHHYWTYESCNQDCEDPLDPIDVSKVFDKNQECNRNWDGLRAYLSDDAIRGLRRNDLKLQGQMDQP